MTPFSQEIYRNVLSREGDEEGVAYWTDALESGTIPRHLFIKAILDGAKGDDATMLNEKTKLSQEILNAGLTQTDAAMIMWFYEKYGYEKAQEEIGTRADRAVFLEQLEIDRDAFEEALEESGLTGDDALEARKEYAKSGLAGAKLAIAKIIEDNAYVAPVSSGGGSTYTPPVDTGDTVDGPELP